MKALKKLYGYGKSLAKHLWDTNKGHIAKLAFKKGMNFIKKKVPIKYKGISMPIIDKVE